MITASDLLYSPRVPIINGEDVVEVVRQRLLTELLLPVAGPLVPAQDDLANVRRVLDIGCGQGIFALELAFAHPELEVAGIDAWPALIGDANAQACDQHLRNASFGVVDLWHPPFDFSDATFDLITASFLCSRLEEDAFLPLLAECSRLLTPGGYVRLVECEAGWCSSPAIQRLSGLYAEALARADLHPLPVKRLHDLAGRSALRQILSEAGLPVCASRRTTLDFSAQHISRYASMRQALSAWWTLIQPFVLQMRVVEEADYVWLVEQAGHEIRLPSFEGTWHLLMFWGQKGTEAGQAASADTPTQAGGASDGPHAIG